MNTWVEMSYFGSVLKVVAYAPEDNFRKFASEAKDFLKSVVLAVDENEQNSDISRFNRATDEVEVEISSITYELFTVAKTVYELTDGAYDPTAYYSVNLWGFGNYGGSEFPVCGQKANGEIVLPADTDVTDFKRLTDFSRLSAFEKDGKYYLKKERTATEIGGKTYYARLDFGGIVKGYAIRYIRSLFAKYNITKGNASYGTSSLCLLKAEDGGNWDLKLTNPRPTDEAYTYCDIQTADIDVATSGDYERCFSSEGKKYSHIIDPKTGRPIENGVASVTVLCDRGDIADGLATGLCVMGKEKLTEFAEAHLEYKITAVFDEGDGIKVYTNVPDTVKITFGERYEA